jgi:tRNA modification GTPase
MDLIFSALNQSFGSSIVVVRLSGSFDDIQKCLAKMGVKLSFKPNYAKLCSLYIGKELIDKALVTYFKAPYSFTGEDVAELSLHASPYIVESVLAFLGSLTGCRQAKAGEFSYRAYLNGKVDLMQAESIDMLVKAKTKLSHKVASQMMDGKTSSLYRGWRDGLVEISALLTCYIDFAEDENISEDFDLQIKNLISKLITSMRHYTNLSAKVNKIQNGIKVCILGMPNAGKSSMLNKILNENYAIVSHIAGTTRDVLEVNANIDSVPCVIYDTAGLRDTKDEIEIEGIKRAKNKIFDADVRVLLCDILNPKSLEDFKEYINEETLVVINKTDKLSKDELRLRLKSFNIIYDTNLVALSVLNGDGYDEFFSILSTKVRQMFSLAIDGSFGLNKRQQEQTIKCITVLEEAFDYSEIELLSEDIRHCIFLLDEVLGVVDSEEILDKVFGDFCIGK